VAGYLRCIGDVFNDGSPHPPQHPLHSPVVE
jgi:hypothetical protein